MSAKILFLKSVTGNPYRLPYLAGSTATLEDKKLAVELIEKGYAEPVATKQETETATLKKGAKAAKKDQDKKQ